MIIIDDLILIRSDFLCFNLKHTILSNDSYLKIVAPNVIAAFSPMILIKNPENGITVPCVIPHADCTTMKSVYVKLGEPY